jgi:hypothetical protein
MKREGRKAICVEVKMSEIIIALMIHQYCLCIRVCMYNVTCVSPLILEQVDYFS